MKLLRCFLLLTLLNTTLLGKTQLEKAIRFCPDDITKPLERYFFQLSSLQHFLVKEERITKKQSKKFILCIKHFFPDTVGTFQDILVEQFDIFEEAMTETYWDQTLQRYWTDEDRFDFAEREFTRMIIEFLEKHYTLPEVSPKNSTKTLLKLLITTITTEDPFELVVSKKSKRRLLNLPW